MLLDLVQIRTNVRLELNQYDNTGFSSDEAIDLFANEGYYKYALWLMRASQGYFEYKQLLDITADTETVALPINFTADRKSHLKTVRLERVLSSANVPLTYRRRNSSEPNYSSGIDGSHYLPTYDFRGGNIVLEPTPKSSVTSGLQLIYQALPPKLRSNTAQAGAASTITLDASADPRDDYYNDARIYISSGTGAGQIRTISNYVGSTKVATVSADWGTNPDATSVFSILVHDDFPELFQDLIYLYSAKKCYLRAQNRGMALSYDTQALKELEAEFKNYIDERTESRKFVEPWHLEL